MTIVYPAPGKLLMIFPGGFSSSLSVLKLDYKGLQGVDSSLRFWMMAIGENAQPVSKNHTKPDKYLKSRNESWFWKAFISESVYIT